MTIEDVYLLGLHEPYESSKHPVPINATIVHARTLLHPALPQPDGARMYRCLTEFPERSEGCVVPLSTLTYELDGGQLWPEIGDWGAIIQGIVRLAQTKNCDAMPLGLPEPTAALLAMGPTSTVQVLSRDGRRSLLGARERERCLDELASYVGNVVAERPFWPGDNLVEVPEQPSAMPYRPYR